MTENSSSGVSVSHAVTSFDEIVTAHKRGVYWLAYDLTGNHHDAEDLSQEVFIKAYRGMSGFRGEAQMGTWLRRIAINTFLNRRRKKALTFMRFFDDEAEEDHRSSDEPSPETRANGTIVREHVERALDVLSERERTAFVLRHFHEMGVRDVAAGMNVAEGTVKSLLFRAAKKLQKELAFLHENNLYG